jgi:hypothetical protein
MANTPNRNYPLPVPSNPVRDDVARLIAAFEAIDGDVAGLLAALATKAAIGHGHSPADIAGLVDALNGKAGINHTHALASLSDVSIAGAPTGRPLTIQPGGTVGVGPDWATAIAGKVSASDVQSDRNDVSWGGDLVRVDGALAASLSTHVNYYGSGAGRNIDEVEAGDVGLYSNTNPGAWPPSGSAFWFVTTQRLYTGSAVVQRAVSYASAAPSTTAYFEYIRVRGNDGTWSSWRKVFIEDGSGKLTVERTVAGAEIALAVRNLSGAVGSQARLDLSVDQPFCYGLFYVQAGSNPIMRVSMGAGVTGGYEIDTGTSSAPVRIKQGGFTRLEVGEDGNVAVSGTIDATGIRVGGAPLKTGPLSAEYVSPEQVIVAGGALTLAHGLAVAPKALALSLVCKTAEYGYVAGDVVPIPNGVDHNTVPSTGVTFRVTATQLIGRFGAHHPMVLLNQTGGAAGNPVGLNSANWRLIVRAFA